MATIAEVFQLAVQYHQAGQAAQAEQLYRQVIQADPNHAQALCNLGVLAVQAGYLDHGLGLYHQALRANPSFAEGYFNLGNLHSKRGQLEEAAGSYREATRLSPQFGAAWYNLGRMLAMLGRFAEAVDALKENVRVSPNSPEVHTLLANALWRSGNTEEGMKHFDEALRINPNFAEGYYALACALSQTGKLAEVEKHLRKVIELRPNHVEAHNNLGITLESLGKVDDAIAEWNQALYYRPQFSAPYNNLGNAYTLQGYIDESIDCFNKAIQLQPGQAHVHSNLLLTLNYHSRRTPESIFADHQHWAQLYTSAIPRLPPAEVDRDPERRLRIGYVSADFRGHTVSAFVEPVLAAHDHERFHITAYANVLHTDDVTKRMMATTDAWRSIIELNDEKAADLIRQDGIDILVDLGGHTAGNRLLLFARKPAPVQTTHFGYPNTTAVPGMDYRLTDVYADPPGMTEQFHTEKLFRLPQMAWCYQPPPDTEVSDLPVARTGQFTFASFNNLAKVSDDTVALWAQILKQVPGSRLMLLSGMGTIGAKRVRELFAKNGVADAERIVWMARRPKDEYFRLYHEVDLALDPFPYNGGVTTCDALWMGVPVLALAGRTYVARQGVALLSNVKLPELIGQTPEECVAIAGRLANDPAHLAGLRAGLRERMRSSIIVDAVRFTRQLEEAYRTMWRQFVAAGK